EDIWKNADHTQQNIDRAANTLGKSSWRTELRYPFRTRLQSARLSKSNCTACVAALYRTLTTGKLWTVDDIYVVKDPITTQPLGVPYPGNFRDESEADHYLAVAMGDGKSPEGSDAKVTKFNLSPTNQMHVVLGFRSSSGEKVYYDPQSGMRVAR